MTVYIGTSQGAKDIGRIRLRSATSSVLTLAENSIDWQDGWYLTVVRYFEPWGVFPRIILDDNNNPTFFKDYDDTYGNQNEVMDPVICMGPNDGGFLNLDEIAPTGSSIWLLQRSRCSWAISMYNTAESCVSASLYAQQSSSNTRTTVSMTSFT